MQSRSEELDEWVINLWGSEWAGFGILQHPKTIDTRLLIGYCGGIRFTFGINDATDCMFRYVPFLVKPPFKNEKGLFYQLPSLQNSVHVVEAALLAGYVGIFCDVQRDRVRAIEVSNRDDPKVISDGPAIVELFKKYQKYMPWLTADGHV